MSFKNISEKLLYELTLINKVPNYENENILKLLISDNISSFTTFCQNFFSLDENKISKLWFYAAEKTFELNSKDGVFKDSEIALLYALLKNDGVIKHSDCRKLRCLHNDVRIAFAASSLMENNIVLREKFTNEVMYILDIEFYIDVIINGKN